MQSWEEFQARFKKKEKPGLEVKFRKGEHIPWKNIWFRVTKVEKDKLELTPTSATAGFYKRRDGQ
jgi:hypothetical protein